MNKLHIIGNLTRDPELRTTQNGISVCTLSVAVNRKKTQNNQDPGVDYFRVTAWRQLGENAAKWLIKGKKIAVVGPVSYTTYTTNDGRQGVTLEVLAEDIEFLSPANQTESTYTPAAPTQAAPAEPAFTQVETDDLPF